MTSIYNAILFNIAYITIVYFLLRDPTYNTDFLVKV
jgi:hypothetical protein